jgi:hypothetical protein
MARTRAEIGELIGKIFDRLDHLSANAEIVDALLLVEIRDNDDTIKIDDNTPEGRDIPATMVMVEGTTDRVVVQAGIIDFAKELLYTRAEEDDEE